MHQDTQSKRRTPHECLNIPRKTHTDFPPLMNVSGHQTKKQKQEREREKEKKKREKKRERHTDCLPFASQDNKKDTLIFHYS